MEEIIRNGQRLAFVPYTNCDTRIVSLKELDLPETASDEEYRQIYLEYTQGAGSNRNASLLRDAVESIRHGIAPPVAFPTETVYGLGADATNEAAISGIFAAKGRPSDNPLIVHAASIAHLERLTGERLPEIYHALAQRFWPGPLTILLPVPKDPRFRFARNVHPGQSTIGFRIPASKSARFFIAATDRPVAGPSANSSGKPSPTTAQHVFDDLKGKINFVLDAGPCDVGVESTVVDGLHDPPLILRPGGVSQSELVAHGRQFANRFAHTAIGYKRHDTTGSGDKDLLDDVDAAPRAPGMKYKHYAPRGRLVLFSEPAVAAGRVAAKFDELVRAFAHSHTGGEDKDGLAVGLISCHWPPFAGLPVTPSSATPSSVVSESVYGPITSVATYTLALTPVPVPQPSTRLEQVVKVTLYNVHIGPDIMHLAHSLFGVLRLFDHLDCTFIFAEAVRRSGGVGDGILRPNADADADADAAVDGNGIGIASAESPTRDIEDAVIDRIEKAATERVES
ncbi:hypothetical protein A1O3_01514 [Capronia epimyces CBS 606.96]|uniref:Threonylcarbamoyl-AMP synthase n=1 Tax=Capronia epimyces CBS 606.96 TaxID=1182542 RepID=W9YK95_9EURO|nr:uncharacterized protein A1O3_01514 [Capronia epimyces CBS 606.96]EXJ92958.1 hypothetical protein A1O3_01514 [Capronia epimyces CBS 606.96]